MKNCFTPLNCNAVTFDAAFWGCRVDVNRQTTLTMEYEMLRRTGRFDAFNIKKSDVQLFGDSDAAKWIEAVSYALSVTPDKKLQRQVDAVVQSYIDAQQEDGYLNSYYQRVEPTKRWTNLRDMHELYCAGHLMEAAVARATYNGRDDLLRTLCRYADHIGTVFGREQGQKHGYPGHPEIELALMRLYQATGEKRYRDLAVYFVHERGTYPYYYDLEAVARGEQPSGAKPGQAYDYSQAHLPLREQTTAEGHSVRACYLYAGMADVAVATSDANLAAVCRRLWKNIINRRMYVTGGLGSAFVYERFTVDYDLPDEGAHAETCAAISLVFFAQRMLNMELKAEYADIMETALYNGVAAGVSLDGQKFFYANRLAVYPPVMERKLQGQNFTSFRQGWFDCVCCPPNIARLYASLGSYVASTKANHLALHLYAAGQIVAPLAAGTVTLDVTTDYPWDGAVAIAVKPSQAQRFTLSLRLPGWCEKPQVRLNGKKLKLEPLTRAGYLVVEREWSPGDQIELDFPMPITRLEAHPSVRQMVGKVALRRGPIVYCLEECDNGADLADIALPRHAPISAVKSRFLDGCVVLRGEATRRDRAGWHNALYRTVHSPRKAVKFTAVPYCLWGNRREGEMRVWLHDET